jgi:hypothetical protein
MLQVIYYILTLLLSFSLFLSCVREPKKSQTDVTTPGGLLLNYIFFYKTKILPTNSFLKKFPARWLDYSQVDVKSVTSICDPTLPENTNYFSCTHSAEFWEFNLPNQTNCDGLNPQDTLDVFSWNCKVTSSGTVVVFSSGLKNGKGLSDLLDFQKGTWKPISLIIEKDNHLLVQTSSVSWWSNDVVLNRTMNSQDKEGTIYIYTNNYTLEKSIELKQKGAIVVEPETILKSGVYSSNPLITIGLTADFSWIEGSFDSIHSCGGIVLYSTYNHLENIKLMDTSIDPLKCNQNTITGIKGLTSSRNSIYKNITVANFMGNGLDIASDNNMFFTIRSFNNSGDGLYIHSSKVTIVDVLSTNNNGHGVYIEGSIHSTVLSVSSNANKRSGIFLSNSQNSFLGNLSLSYNLIGIELIGSSNITINNLLSYKNTLYPILDSDNKNIIIGKSKVSQKEKDKCLNKKDSNPQQEKLCDLFFLQKNNLEVIEENIEFETIYPLTDSSSVEQRNYTVLYTDIQSWNNFSSDYITIGKKLENPIAGGRCEYNENCSFYDWRLNAKDRLNLNSNHCPTVDDFVQIKYSDIETMMLNNSVERFGYGNYNGICEVNETCVYTPNYGSYQGHGSLVTSLMSDCKHELLYKGEKIQVLFLETNGY